MNWGGLPWSHRGTGVHDSAGQARPYLPLTGARATGPERAVEGLDAFAQTGQAETAAAALIMTGVFGGFVGGADAMIKSLGLGLAAAVVFDAFVVRMTIVPAVLALLGQRTWSLPGWLDRRLPHVDIEGEKLDTAIPASSEPGHRDADFTPTH